jgi:DHA1 family bicyclomycin/chloramphenicol resistance-like MFS transporter
LLLGGMATIGPIGLSIHIQSIPAIATDLETSYASAQLTVSLFLFTFAFAQFFVGPLSDRLGRRPVLFGGLAIFALAGFAAALAPSIEILLCARMVQAIGGCASLVTPRAVIQDSYRGVKAVQIMAYVAILQSTAPIMAPAIGGGLDTAFGWRSIFAFLGVYAIAVGICAAIWLKESRPKEGGKVASWAEIFTRYRGLLSSRRYIAYTAIFALGTTGYFGFLATGPAVMITGQGLEAWQFSIMLTTISVQFVVGGYVAARLVVLFGVDRLLLIGASMQLAAVAVFFAIAHDPDPVLVTASFCFYAFSNGFIFANSLAGATSIDPRIAGSAASFLGAMQFLVGGIITMSLAELPTTNFGYLPLVMAFLAGGAWIAALVLRRAQPY